MPVSDSNAELTAPRRGRGRDRASTATSRRCRSAAPCPRGWRRRRRPPAGRACRALGGVDHDHRDREQREHRAEDRPALPAAADHAPVGVRQRGRDRAASPASRGSSSARSGSRTGYDELTLKKPPPLVPSTLMISCEATGPPAPSDCTTPWEASTSAPTTEIGSSTYRIARVRSCQKLPSRRAAWRAAIAADQRDRDDDADGRGDEVLHRQTGHLAEVRERRLAAVVLPVRVRDERRRRVEAQVPGARVEAVRVERVQRLRAQDQVEREPERPEKTSSEPA